MAVTKIWAVTDSVNRVLSYAANPDKTIYSDICKALHYASDERKTVIGEEKAMYVTGVNCTAETAFAEMKAVQERFDKTVGNVAYHAYQSFKTGEVKPQIAHKLGVELAKRMWGDQYQVLVATHFNTGTYHNHLVINSVNMWNGKKFNCNEGAYWKLRSISDELCKENGLIVIKNPKGKTPRKLYFAEKNGEPTRYNLMREAIDKALTMSTNSKTFTYVMKWLGYVVDMNPYHKYATICSVNSKKATRLYRLGEGYDRDAIYDRMRDTLQNNSQKAYRLYYEFTPKKSFGVTIQKAHFAKGNLKTAKKITGLKALYFRYLYLLGVFPKNKKHNPVSPEMCEACRWLDRHAAQVQLICDNHLTDIFSSGHRRLAACQVLGIETIPVIVREMSDDEAVIAMVDVNLQRETILPSEKAFAYKMKLDAIKHQGKTSVQVAEKLLSVEKVAEEAGESKDQVRRYIRLTYLIPELLSMVDDNKIAFNPAVEISYLDREEQLTLLDAINMNDCTPSHAQSIRLKKMSQDGLLTADAVYAVLSEEKPNQKEQIKLPRDELRKYFPQNYSDEQIKRDILKGLELLKRQRERNRGAR